MPVSQTVNAKALPRSSTKELDIFAAEFAKLVERYKPSREESPSDWLGRLPNEAFRYYDRGIASFGDDARTPIKRRGRLYLIHTSLLFMWMSWGKEAARERFQSVPERGIRRASSLAALEYQKRGGLLARYGTSDWFFEPVDQWRVLLRSQLASPEAASDHSMRVALQEKETIPCSVKAVSQLVKDGALPRRGELSLS